MILVRRYKTRLLASPVWAAALVMLSVCCAAHGAEAPVGVALITDGPQHQLPEVEEIFRAELEVLTNGEFELAWTVIPSGWSAEGVEKALTQAYGDPGVDLVLVLGLAANQLAINRPSFPKPTFLPLIVVPELLGAPSADGRSGRRNLNYLADRASSAEDLATFQRVVSFSHAAVLLDSVLLSALPGAPALMQAAMPGVRFTMVGHDGVDHDLIARFPADVDAVLVGDLSRMPSAEFDRLVDQLAARGIPGFSLVGERDVRRGLLAADGVETDFTRIARRNALNMQAVLLGERAQDQPVYFEGKRELTINMETARRIGLSPRFDVLSEARLINIERAVDTAALTLDSVARLALERNLDLAASRLDVAIGGQEVLTARSALLPQVGVGASYTARRDEPLARGPGAAERSSSGALTLNQLIYSESATAGYQQQKLLQRGREALFDADRLDRILEATTAYLQALRAQTQMEIQSENLNLTKTNLELAQDRVRIGSASKADVFRWESNLASARSAMLDALTARQQTRESLNRVLSRPITTPVTLEKPSKDTPFSMSAEAFDELIDSPRKFGWFVEYTVNFGLEVAPELRQLQAQIDAVERDIVARRRSYWLPEFSVQAQYLDSIDASGLGSGSDFDALNDWNISLSGSLPLFSGGARRAALSRSSLQKQQLGLLYAAAEERVEESIRAAFHAAQSSYINIDFSQRGAQAARENLALVSDAYGQGTVSIVELLDAQNQSLAASLSANNAVHDFLIDVMQLQRAAGQFDFLLPPATRAERAEALRNYIERRAAALNEPGGR